MKYRRQELIHNVMVIQDVMYYGELRTSLTCYKKAII